jgi:hypothetical protein
MHCQCLQNLIAGYITRGLGTWEAPLLLPNTIYIHKPFGYLNNLLGDHISWEHTFQSHNQLVAMQVYIKHRKDY